MVGSMSSPAADGGLPRAQTGLWHSLASGELLNSVMSRALSPEIEGFVVTLCSLSLLMRSFMIVLSSDPDLESPGLKPLLGPRDHSGRRRQGLRVQVGSVHVLMFLAPQAVIGEQADIAQDGSIVFNLGDQQQIVLVESEEQFTSALVKLLNPDVRAIYFLTGHGEYGLDGGEQSFSQVKRVLESKNYKVETLNLLSGGEIPEDAELLIVAAPQKPITQEEVEIIDQFLSAGNGLIVMQEPPPLTDFGEAQDTMALYLTEQWGLTLGEDVVIDQLSPRQVDAVGSVWGNHPIVNNLGTYVVVFPAARSVTLTSAPSGVSQAQLVSTTNQAWAETDFESLASDGTEIIFDETVDLPGPVPLAAVGENFSTDARVVVYGDVDFSVDANFGFYANTDLFINSADWAAGEDDLIDITPKTRTQRLLVPPQPALVNFIFLVTVVVIPATALLGGIYTWFQRRKRG